MNSRRIALLTTVSYPLTVIGYCLLCSLTGTWGAAPPSVHAMCLAIMLPACGIAAIVIDSNEGGS
jgi:hypothetical protein